MSLFETMASFCGKLIGQGRKKGGGGAGAKRFGIIEATKPAICRGKIKAHPHFTLSTLLFLVFALSFYELIFIWCCITLWWLHHTSLRPLSEDDGFHLAGQLALFQGKDLLRSGSVAKQRDLFVFGISLSPALNPHSAVVAVRASKIRPDFICNHWPSLKRNI